MVVGGGGTNSAEPKYLEKRARHVSVSSVVVSYNNDHNNNNNNNTINNKYNAHYHYYQYYDYYCISCICYNYYTLLAEPKWPSISIVSSMVWYRVT